MFPAASRHHSSQKTVSTPWMFDELKGGREEVTLSAFYPTPGWKGGLLSLFRLCAGRCGRTPNLSVSPSSQVPLCTFSFSGLIESEKLKYLERSSPLEECPLRPCICVFLFPGVHSILMLMIPKFRSTLWTLRGPRPYVCLPFRHLLLDVHRKPPCPDLFSASSCLQSLCVFWPCEWPGTHVLSLSLLDTSSLHLGLWYLLPTLSPWPLLQALLSLAWPIPAPLLLPHPTTSHHAVSLAAKRCNYTWDHAISLIKIIRIASKHLSKAYKILLSPLSLSHATFPQHWKLQSYSTVSPCPTAVPLALGPLAGAVHSYLSDT